MLQFSSGLVNFHHHGVSLVRGNSKKEEKEEEEEG